MYADLMDVTLRDGSYAINFQFSEYDTEIITECLSNAGVKYIEVGHGVGLGASKTTENPALCSDEGYIQAAKRGAGSAKIGMFCIPGTARLSDLDVLKDNGGDFVRIGTNVTEVENSKPYIRHAKELGLEVMANYMKSYVVSPKMFAENAKKSEDYGTDCLYIVDSAGSMDEQIIEEYFLAVKADCNMKIGFHGHNNLGLAVANSLKAFKLGFDFIDTSLMGMGRSSGNASTEIFVANLVKRGINLGYDLKELIDCAETYIKPLWKHDSNAIDLFCGIGEFHTSYIKYIAKTSIKYRVNPLDLIIAYSKVDKVSIDEQKLEEVASELPIDRHCNYARFGFNEYIGSEQEPMSNRREKV